MFKFTTVLTGIMKSNQANAQNAQVDIENVTLYTDDYGAVTESGVVQSGVDCGFYFTTGTRVDKGTVVITNYDAEMRLDLDVQIGINDHVTLRELAGQVHSEEFDVYEYPKVGVSSQIVYLRRTSS